MKLILVDRNVIDLMNRNNKGLKIEEGKMREKLLQLQEMDKEGFVFSPLFSILEGKFKKKIINGKSTIIKNTSKKLKEDIISDITILGDFIKKARTDENFNKENISKIRKIIYDQEMDKLLNDKIDLVNDFREKFNKNVENRKNKIDVLKEIINNYPELKYHPLIMCMLLHIFDVPNATKCLKVESKKFDGYNVVADFNHIHQTKKLVLEIKKSKDDVIKRGYIFMKKTPEDAEFFSIDSDPDFISSLYTMTSINPVYHTSYTIHNNTEFNYDWELISSKILGDEEKKNLFWHVVYNIFGEKYKINDDKNIEAIKNIFMPKSKY